MILHVLKISVTIQPTRWPSTSRTTYSTSTSKGGGLVSCERSLFSANNCVCLDLNVHTSSIVHHNSYFHKREHHYGQPFPSLPHISSPSHLNQCSTSPLMCSVYYLKKSESYIPQMKKNTAKLNEDS